MTHRLRAKLESEGHNVDALGLKRPPDMVRFFSHFRIPSLAAWLFNGAEDGRLEAIMERRFPGLVRIHQSHDQLYSRDVIGSPYGKSASGNLISAIGMMAAARPVIARIAEQDRECFERAKAILRKHKLSSVYESARVTHALYMLLEEHLGKEELQQQAESPSFKLRIDPEEIIVRKLISEREGEQAIFNSDGKPMSDPLFQPKTPGIWLPEFDGDRHHEKATHVTVRPFVATKQTPLLPPLDRPFSVESFARTMPVEGDEEHWHESGELLATDRFAEYRANRVAGYFGTEMRYDLTEQNPAMRVTLLFDLSAKMEARRHALGGDSPLQRAIQFGTWMASSLEAQGVEVEAFGGIDGGGKLCRLFRLPSTASRSISMLRAHGFGGFRAGAFVRALREYSPTLGMNRPPGEHRLVILTDGSPTYLGLDRESVFTGLWKNNCPNCTTRQACRVQSVKGAIGQRKGIPNVFQPLGYGLTDMAEAIAAAEPVMQTHVMLFGGSVDASQFDHYLGPGNWSEPEMAPKLAKS